MTSVQQRRLGLAPIGGAAVAILIGGLISLYELMQILWISFPLGDGIIFSVFVVFFVFLAGMTLVEGNGGL